ncbi:13451_t:CDS:2, partial [Funneliformis mosseae]
MHSIENKIQIQQQLVLIIDKSPSISMTDKQDSAPTTSIGSIDPNKLAPLFALCNRLER